MKTQILVTAALAAVLAFSMPVSAEPLFEVGLSGQCYNEDASEGGQGELKVSDEEIVILDAVDTANALVMFGSGTAEDRDTGSACDRYDCYNEAQCDGRTQRSDYLEAHAEVAGEGTQVCYDGSVTTAGSCPTSPTGPGSE